MVRTPLHGTTTHPLSEHALNVLAQLAVSPMPRQSVNPGVTNRLEREALVESVDLPSPFPTVKRSVSHLQITPAGREALRQATTTRGS